MNNEYYSFIKTECAKQGLEPELIAAIVQTESAWSSNAMRYEPKYPKTWNAQKYATALKISLDTETVLQKMSYGLMQVMGANLRWLGFEGPLPQALDPEISLKYGCLLFKKMCDSYADLMDKIAAYNAGTPRRLTDGSYANQKYVDKVYTVYKDLKKA